jgi:hypothetical protein
VSQGTIKREPSLLILIDIDFSLLHDQVAFKEVCRGRRRFRGLPLMVMMMMMVMNGILFTGFHASLRGLCA